ncbi:MAG TPA: TetR/AcrR family transcriptional regulator [Ktedonobacteraceae bacterium]|nr:TetR/AcrR family transcriptional regulator [Ktedonobacteraceae bacterium]
MAKGMARERRQARTREAIIQAAGEIIEAQGPDALNMRNVAERIDYSASNLYEYFSSKDDLLATVIKEALARLVLRVRQIPPDLSAHEHLQSFGRAYLEFALTHPELYLLIFGRKVPQMIDPQENLCDILREVIQKGIAEGVFAARPDFGLDEMTFGCWSLVHGIAMLRLTGHNRQLENPDVNDSHILAGFAEGLNIR